LEGGCTPGWEIIDVTMMGTVQMNRDV